MTSPVTKKVRKSPAKKGTKKGVTMKEKGQSSKSKEKELLHAVKGSTPELLAEVKTGEKVKTLEEIDKGMMNKKVSAVVADDTVLDIREEEGNTKKSKEIEKGEKEVSKEKAKDFDLMINKGRLLMKIKTEKGDSNKPAELPARRQPSERIKARSLSCQVSDPLVAIDIENSPPPKAPELSAEDPPMRLPGNDIPADNDEPLGEVIATETGDGEPTHMVRTYRGPFLPRFLKKRTRTGHPKQPMDYNVAEKGNSNPVLDRTKIVAADLAYDQRTVVDNVVETQVDAGLKHFQHMTVGDSQIAVNDHYPQTVSEERTTLDSTIDRQPSVVSGSLVAAPKTNYPDIVPQRNTNSNPSRSSVQSENSVRIRAAQSVQSHSSPQLPQPPSLGISSDQLPECQAPATLTDHQIDLQASADQVMAGPAVPAQRARRSIRVKSRPQPNPDGTMPKKARGVVTNVKLGELINSLGKNPDGTKKRIDLAVSRDGTNCATKEDGSLLTHTIGSYVKSSVPMLASSFTKLLEYVWTDLKNYISTYYVLEGEEKEWLETLILTIAKDSYCYWKSRCSLLYREDPNDMH